MSHEQVYPYSERDAVVADEAIGALVLQAEIDPESNELRELRSFAHELFDGPEQADGSRRSLEDINKMSTESASSTFYLDYLYTAEGRKNLNELGITNGLEPMNTVKSLCTLVANGEAPTLADRKRVAIASRDWYINKLTQSQFTETAVEPWNDCPTYNINFNPDKLLTKFEALQEFRSYYRVIAHSLQEEDTLASVRQSQLLAIHVAKVNSMTATLYPDVLDLAKQLGISPTTERTQAWQRRLFAAAPVIRDLYKQDTEDNSQLETTLLRRLDMVRNGAERTDTETFSAISAKDIQLADELDQVAQADIAKETQTIPPELVTELEMQTWDATMLADLLGKILGQYELLSSETATTDEVEERNGSAGDHGWQVIIDPKVKALSVNNVKRVMRVPKGLSQDGVKSLAVAAHELTHVLQCEGDIKMAENVPLARIKGRRSQGGREMGGIYEERIVYAMFGRDRPSSNAYLRALEVKEAGGNQLEGAKTYQRSLNGNKAISPAELQRNAKIASDRMLRLYRKGGYDSQALDYLEQELLLRSMSQLPQDEVRAIASSAMSFSLKDAATLHNIGLLELPTGDQIRRPADDVVKLYLAERTA